jgi:hypothetical protein
MKYAKPRQYEKISRYQIYRLIMDSLNNTYTETSNSTPVKDSDRDVYHEVQQNEENRLDIISNKYYGSPEYYWLIAMANDIVDPFVVRVGDVLRIPYFYSAFEWKGALCGRV